MVKTTDNKSMLMIAGTASMIAQFNMNNIKLLLSMGYKVDVACNFLEGNNFSQKKIEELKQQLNTLGVEIYQIDFSRKVTNLNADIKAYNEILALLREKQYAFVHCHMPIVSVLVRKACHKTGTKVVYTAHGFHFFKGAPLKNWLIYYPIEKHYSRYTDVLITINHEDYERAKKSFKAKRIVYVPGVGVDTEKFSNFQFTEKSKNEIRRSLGIPQNSILLLSVGELSKRKNHEVIIKALSKIENKNIFYCIAGIGKLNDQLKDLASKLGVSERVHLLGYRCDVKELCLSSDVFVFPSLQEGLPVALMEAMCCGLPCVATAIRGNTELIDNNGGRLFKSNDENECIEAINNIISITQNQRKLLGLYNQNKIKKFDQNTVEKNMERVYRDV